MAPDAEQTRVPLQALEQKRASKAWEQVKGIEQGSKLGENYRAVVRKAPAMIKTNGLGQMLAYLLAKEEKDAQALLSTQPKEADGCLYKHLEEWMLSAEAPIPWTRRSDDTLIERVIHEDSAIYRQATGEALAYLGWLKRFAEARFGGQKQSGE